MTQLKVPQRGFQEKVVLDNNKARARLMTVVQAKDQVVVKVPVTVKEELVKVEAPKAVDSTVQAAV